MPLDREHITLGQRVMTIVNAVFASGLGLGYTFGATQLEHQPSYAAAADILPLSYQGIGFLGIAALLIFALMSHRRGVYVAGLAWLTAWMLVWTGIILKITLDGQASFLGAWYPAYVVCACWASLLALISRER